jgi:DNA-binding transcriptional ArsR family regulator
LNAAPVAFISTNIEMTDNYLEMPDRADLELSAVLHALSDPVRIEIVSTLAAGGERACGTLALPVSDSTRSHHLRVLRDAGVTATRVDGTRRMVSLRRGDVDARFPGLLDSVLAAATAA